MQKEDINPFPSPYDSTLAKLFTLMQEPSTGQKLWSLSIWFHIFDTFSLIFIFPAALTNYLLSYFVWFNYFIFVTIYFIWRIWLQIIFNVCLIQRRGRGRMNDSKEERENEKNSYNIWFKRREDILNDF